MPNPFPSGPGYLETTGSCKMLHFDFGFVTSRGSSPLHGYLIVLFQLYFFKGLPVQMGLWSSPTLSEDSIHFYNLIPGYQIGLSLRATPIDWILRPLDAQ